MVKTRISDSKLAENGVYLVAGAGGTLRALVDERFAAAMPVIRHMIENLAAPLQKALPDGVAVSIRFEPGPGRGADAARVQGALVQSTVERVAG